MADTTGFSEGGDIAVPDFDVYAIEVLRGELVEQMARGENEPAVEEREAREEEERLAERREKRRTAKERARARRAGNSNSARVNDGRHCTSGKDELEKNGDNSQRAGACSTEEEKWKTARKPQSSWDIFVEQRALTKTPFEGDLLHPNGRPKTFWQLCSQEWKGMSSSRKLSFQTEAKRRKAIYLQLHPEYVTSTKKLEADRRRRKASVASQARRARSIQPSKRSYRFSSKKRRAHAAFQEEERIKTTKLPKFIRRSSSVLPRKPVPRFFKRRSTKPEENSRATGKDADPGRDGLPADFLAYRPLLVKEAASAGAHQLLKPPEVSAFFDKPAHLKQPRKVYSRRWRFRQKPLPVECGYCVGLGFRGILAGHAEETCRSKARHRKCKGRQQEGPAPPPLSSNSDCSKRNAGQWSRRSDGKEFWDLTLSDDEDDLSRYRVHYHEPTLEADEPVTSAHPRRLLSEQPRMVASAPLEPDDQIQPFETELPITTRMPAPRPAPVKAMITDRDDFAFYLQERAASPLPTLTPESQAFLEGLLREDSPDHAVSSKSRYISAPWSSFQPSRPAIPGLQNRTSDNGAGQGKTWSVPYQARLFSGIGTNSEGSCDDVFIDYPSQLAEMDFLLRAAGLKS